MFKKGHIAWNKGLTKETDRRVKKISESSKGKIMSDVSKEKMSKAKSGISTWNKGLTAKTDERVKNYADSNKGEKNHNWKGGISCEPYCDVWTDKEYKQSIKERDNFQCQNPDCWKKSKRLTLHHINYIKKDCRPLNLITLCNSCNVRANKNREWHKSWYEIIIRRKN